MSELYRSPESDFVPIDNVLHLQSLAMGVFREKARRVKSADKMTGFVLFDSSDGDMSSNDTDTYMGVISRRIKHNYWQFSVYFLTYMMNHELRYSNTREQFRFNWDSTGTCVGTKTTTDHYNPVIGTRNEPLLGPIDTVKTHTATDWYPLYEHDCEELRQRMMATVANVEFSLPKNSSNHWGTP